jgi:hypothetical protein
VLAIGDKDVGRTVQGSAEGPQGKPAPEEGMRRVDDLDLGYLLGWRVIEWGSKV